MQVKRKINGILVLSAEKAIKSFDEGFIIGLARNKGVDFVQAFTNHAELVAKKLEKILQALLLDNVEEGFCIGSFILIHISLVIIYDSSKMTD